MPALSPSVAFLPARKPGGRNEWNVYLHHPRGTVERVAGPFSDEEQAKGEIDTQMSFGLFSEAKGYQWEYRGELEGTVESTQQPNSEQELEAKAALSMKPQLPNLGEGQTLQQICEQYGISFKNFKRNRENKGQSALEYLRSQTGLEWVQRGKRYLPTETLN